MESKREKDVPKLGAKESMDLFCEKSYSQQYIVLKEKPWDPEVKRHVGNEVLFGCGNWCYSGIVLFENITMKISEIPRIIPTLQKQQANLHYLCHSKDINSLGSSCSFVEPAGFLQNATNFFANQICSSQIEKELENLAKMFTWVEDDDNAAAYFELEVDPQTAPKSMSAVAIMAAKTYIRGLIVISIYSQGTFYFILQSGEGEQALLDVRFPDVTQRGQGMHLASYTLNDAPWQKLTVWHLLGTTASTGSEMASGQGPDTSGSLRSVSLSSQHYQQTYCVLKSAWEGVSPTINMHHQALFRFGSWCYAGTVQLTPTISLQDVPFVIPALRLQQPCLEYLCPVDQVPTTSPFAKALAYLQARESILEQVIEDSANALEALLERLNGMGLGGAVTQWLDGDAASSFYEFKIEPDDATKEIFKAIELVASKTYHASGVTTKQIFFNFTLYVCVEDCSSENPLLDSTFPDVSGKGRGYQIYNYAEPSSSPLANPGPGGAKGGAAIAPGGGHVLWPELKRVSIWQTTAALEQEFRDRAAEMARKAHVAENEERARERYPQFGLKSEVAMGARATAHDIIAEASIGDASIASLSLLAHGAHDNASLSQASDTGQQLLPSSKAYFPVLQEGKDWRQNTDGPSVVDVGTGTIKGSVHNISPKIYNEGSIALNSEEDSHSVSREGALGAGGASIASGASGGSWRSMGSVHGGKWGGVGGRGIQPHSVTSATGSVSYDSQGREIIGSSYRYREGFDLADHARTREYEFVRDTRERNRADLKALQHSESSISGRINSFVNSYNEATSKPLSPNKPEVRTGSTPQVAEAKFQEQAPSSAEAAWSPSSDMGTDDKKAEPWDTVGRLVQDYEAKQIANSRSQLLQPMSDIDPLVSSQEYDGLAKISQEHVVEGEFELEAALGDELEGGSVSTLGQDSVQHSVGWPQPLDLEQTRPSGVRSWGDSNNNRPALPKFGGGLPDGVRPELGWGRGSVNMARPHHLPQMTDSLSSRLDTIRATMALKVQQQVPWDTTGNPLHLRGSAGIGSGSSHK